MSTRRAFWVPIVAALPLGVCGGDDAPAGACTPHTVVVYSALDQEFAEPILEDYPRKAGVDFLPKFAVEGTRTVGLTASIVAEAGRPRCDVSWNNEILNMLRLREKGVLAPFRPKHAADLPDAFKANDGTWYGFAARARILLVNTKLVPEAGRPKGIRDLFDAKWKRKLGIARPLFGTTATHAARLFAARGDDRARAFFRDPKANEVQILSGNRQVAAAVGSGQIAFGLTDTDDAMGEVDAGSPVAIFHPGREPGQLGTLFIPNTPAVIKGVPHPEAAEALADHLLSPEVESALAAGPGVQVSLPRTTKGSARVETPKTVHATRSTSARR